MNGGEKHMSQTIELQAAGRPELAGKYLTFQLGREEFAVRVTQVREIMGIQEMTEVPPTPVFNLRGRVVPIISLRLKLGIAEEPYTARTCIIVVDMPGENGIVPVGVVVDGVSEVVNLQGVDMEATPDFGRGRAAPYLLGMAKLKGKVKMLLDLDFVLTATEVLGLAEILPEAA
jgi:purine-binding chemotaxis protein CheW